MKILLINSPIRLSAEPSCIPIGLAQIASYLRENGFGDIDILDANGLRCNQNQIVEHVYKYDPDIIGISGLITTITFQKNLVRKLRAEGFDKTIVSGGGCATSSSSLLLKEKNIDIFVIGEGEHTMLELAHAIDKCTDLHAINGIIYQEGNTYRVNHPRKNEVNIDIFPMPAYDLLPVDVYAKNHIWGGENTRNKYEGFDSCDINRDMNMISSRGCPFKCNFCYHIFGRGNYRFRSAKNIMHEIEFLRDECNIDFISFVDDNMLTHKKRTIEFCRLMQTSGIKWGCLARVSDITEEYVKDLKSGGCMGIGFGLESGSPIILKNMNKMTTIDQAEKAFEILNAYDIYANGTFILGYPGENWDTIRETKAFCQRINIEQTFFFATPYPGTPLWNIARPLIEDEESFIEKLGDADEFLINLSELSDAELFEAKRFLES